MEQDSNQGPVNRVREVAGIVKRLGCVMKGRIREWAVERDRELGNTLREVREELDAEIAETAKSADSPDVVKASEHPSGESK